MTFEAFEARLAAVKAARSGVDLPEGFALFDELTATPADLDRVERELDVTLPAVYKEFLVRVGGGLFLYLDLLPAVAAEESEEDLISVNSGPGRIPGFIAIAPVGTVTGGASASRTAIAPRTRCISGLTMTASSSSRRRTFWSSSPPKGWRHDRDTTRTGRSRCRASSRTG